MTDKDDRDYVIEELNYLIQFVRYNDPDYTVEDIEESINSNIMPILLEIGEERDN